LLRKHQLTLEGKNIYGESVTEFRFSLVDVAKDPQVWDVGSKEGRAILHRDASGT
jgi:hypothetical protein